MSTLPVLEVAIGLSFTYLLLALITTAVTEWIARLSNARGRMLLQGVRQLVGEEDGDQSPVTNEILSHPLIRPLGETKRSGKYRVPSYIPGDLFAKALTDVVDTLTKRATEEGRSQISPRLQHALRTLHPSTRESVASDSANIALWYDQNMDRVSGWYKRHTQTIVLSIAVVLTLLTNADTVHLARRLWSDSALREAVVELAKVRLQQGPPLETVEYVDPTTPKPTKPVQGDNANQVLPEEQTLLESMLGWSGELATLEAFWKSGSLAGMAGWLALHLFGWLITAIAIALGAPFWFDTLNRLMNIRSSGPPPATSSSAK
jgi:hypothetical protein